jgi:hypothetical protein
MNQVQVTDLRTRGPASPSITLCASTVLIYEAICWFLGHFDSILLISYRLRILFTNTILYMPGLAFNHLHASKVLIYEAIRGVPGHFRAIAFCIIA